MKARASGPWLVLISVNLEAMSVRASSHVASTKRSPWRMRGLVRRSSELMYSQANLPLMQVEMPLAGPGPGSTLRMWRSLGPDVEAAAYSAVGADGLGLLDAELAHVGFDF